MDTISEDNSPKFGPCKINYPLYRLVTHLKSIAFCHSRSLQALDNIAADDAAGFQTMDRIVDNLKEKGSDRELCKGKGKGKARHHKKS